MPDTFPPPPSLRDFADRAREGFHAAFAAEPAALAQAPGRINIIGEHVDYQGGLVLPMAIGRWCLCAIGPSAAPGLHLAALDLGERWSSPHLTTLRPADHDDPARGLIRRGSWPSYIAGVAALFLAPHTDAPRGLNIAVTSSVPRGAGLSSSAALEVSVAAALEEVTRRPLSPEDRARLCQRAEHEFAGVPCGIMDQLIACRARADHALLVRCSNPLLTNAVPLPTNHTWLVVNSGVRHALADSDYTRPQRLAADAAARLRIDTFGAVALGLSSPKAEELGARVAQLPDDLSRVARHHLQENARAITVAEALSSGRTDLVRQALFDSHRSLDENLNVSCPELNTIVAAAREAPGVIGARMTGAGFGGSAIVLVETSSAPNAAEHIRVRYRTAHNRDPDIFSVEAVGAAGPL